MVDTYSKTKISFRLYTCMDSRTFVVVVVVVVVLLRTLVINYKLGQSGSLKKSESTLSVSILIIIRSTQKGLKRTPIC